MLSEELKQIIKKEKDIIPFLRKLDTKQKKEIVPTLKELNKEYNTTYEVRKKGSFGMSISYEYRSTEKQRSLLNKASFVCFNKADFKKTGWNPSNILFKENYVDEILPWYQPKWLGDLINEEQPWSLDYLTMVELARKGILAPSDALIALKLPEVIEERKGEGVKTKFYYRPERLFIFPETLDKHIWTLLTEEEHNINYRFHGKFENYNEKPDIWIYTFKKLVDDQKIDRKKLLHHILMTPTYNYNKNLTGWYFDLLIALQPEKNEIHKYQQDFFVGFNSPHSKVINTILKYFKIVALDKKFDAEQFINSASLLLTSETKSVVTSSLMVLEKIAKSRKKLQEEICLKVTESFVNQDDKIQSRAAKIIAKYGDNKNEELLQLIDQYQETLFFEPKEILQIFMPQEVKEIEENEPLEKTIFITDENLLEAYATLDELIFFVSQVLDNNEDYHIDLFLSYMPKLHLLLNQQNVSKLEPLFKRALDLSLNFEGWNSNIGGLEVEAAYYVNDYAMLQLERYPKALANYKKYRTTKIKKVNANDYFRKFLNQSLKKLELQPLDDHIYKVYRTLFLKSKQLITKQVDIPLLSMPTHFPCWVDPIILIQRIQQYEKSNITIELTDWQMALLRIPLQSASSDLSKLTERIHSNEHRSILKYLLGNDSLEIEKVKNPEFWITAILSKGKEDDINTFKEITKNDLIKETSNYSWSCKLHKHRYKDWDYVKMKQVEKVIDKKLLKLHENKTAEKESISVLGNLKKVFAKPFKANTAKQVPSIYNHFKFKVNYYATIKSNDDRKFLLLSPNHPTVFLTQLIRHNLKESTFSHEEAKRNMTNTLKVLNDIWYDRNYDDITYIFVATSFLCSERVAREIVAELWIKTNYEKAINNNLLGEFLGKLQYNEYAPLKRFTDILTESIFNISNVHNIALLELLNSMVKEMHDTPIRNCRKLLEIFTELKLKNPEHQLHPSTVSKLDIWMKNKSLKPVIVKLKN